MPTPLDITVIPENKKELRERVLAGTYGHPMVCSVSQSQAFYRDLEVVYGTDHLPEATRKMMLDHMWSNTDDVGYLAVSDAYETIVEFTLEVINSLGINLK